MADVGFHVGIIDQAALLFVLFVFAESVHGDVEEQVGEAAYVVAKLLVLIVAEGQGSEVFQQVAALGADLGFGDLDPLMPVQFAAPLKLVLHPAQRFGGFAGHFGAVLFLGIQGGDGLINGREQAILPGDRVGGLGRREHLREGFPRAALAGFEHLPGEVIGAGHVGQLADLAPPVVGFALGLFGEAELVGEAVHGLDARLREHLRQRFVEQPLFVAVGDDLHQGRHACLEGKAL